MRLFSRSRSSHSSCHSDGRLEGVTCTAVTLYSGQLVAQSEFSVVMTLAPLIGKWKVVCTTPGGTRSLILTRKVVPPARLVTRGQRAVLDAAHLGIASMHLEDVLLVPDDVFGAPRLRADVVLAEDAAGGEDEREVASWSAPASARTR